MPDVAFDGSRPAFSVERFKDEIYPMLSSNDARCVDIFFLSRDNANIINILRDGENAVIDSMGCYTREELDEIIASAINGDITEQIYHKDESFLPLYAAQNLI